MTPNTKLTAKQNRFVKEYCLDFNGAQAAIRAGYSKKTARQAASRLLSNANIQRGVQMEIRKAECDLDISREQIIKDLIEIKDQQKAKNPYASIRAVEVIAKLRGWFDPKINLSTDNELVVRWAATPEEAGE